MTPNQSRALQVAILSLSMAAAASGADKPAAVSPGDASRVAVVASACPTFSWGAVDSARGYEIAVVELGEGRGLRPMAASPMLRQRVRGAALSWTPDLGRCLRRGASYAWSVRAVGGATREWSEPRLFRVEAAPSAAQVEDALALLRRYVAAAGEGAASAATTAATTATTTAASADAAQRRATRESGVDRGSAGAAGPQTLTHGTGAPFSIGSGGTVTAHLFIGDGSGLTGVNASSLQGNSPSAFASSGHSHQLSELTVGTGAGPALVEPTFADTCSGASGSSSSCTATCSSGVMVGGGCTNDTPDPTACAATSSAVKTSRPTDSPAESWFCEVVCTDGTSNVKALGEVICAGTVP